jgi:hypothetical protein
MYFPCKPNVSAWLKAPKVTGPQWLLFIISPLVILALSQVDRANAQYTGATYGGGTAIGNSSNSFPYAPESTDNNISPYSYGAVAGAKPTPTQDTCSASGAITTTYTWSSALVMPPQVAIAEQSAGVSYQNDKYATGGTDNNELGGTNPGNGDVWAATLYSLYVNPGQNVSLPDPGLSSSDACYMGSGPKEPVQSIVGYTAALYPITLQLTGTTLDSSGTQDIIVGQPFSAKVLGLPGGLAYTYKWSVTGSNNTFQTWASTTPAIGGNPANPNQSYEVDGLGTVTNVSASWFWKDLTSTTETVSCVVTAAPPTGEGSVMSFTVTQGVKVCVPPWFAAAQAGPVEVWQPSPPPSDYFLQAIGENNTFPHGMTWTADTGPWPAGTPFTGIGTLEVVQTVTPALGYSSAEGSYHWNINGVLGLDTECPYDGMNTGPGYTDGDSPSIDLTSMEATSAYMNHQFTDVLLYFAPSATQCVPLATMSWHITSSVTEPLGGWVFNGNAGTVYPTGSSMFDQSNIFPTWQQIDNAAAAIWVAN